MKPELNKTYRRRDDTLRPATITKVLAQNPAYPNHIYVDTTGRTYDHAGRYLVDSPSAWDLILDSYDALTFDDDGWSNPVVIHPEMPGWIRADDVIRTGPQDSQPGTLARHPQLNHTLAIQIQRRQTPTPNEWHLHDGGAQPVPDNTVVEFRTREPEQQYYTAPAQDLVWPHDPNWPEADIICWRIVE